MRTTYMVAAAVLAIWTTGCGGPAVPTYEMRALVEGGSKFHGVHGLRFDQDDNLYAVSVIGQSIFKVDTETGAVETFIGPPEGMADDLAFGPDGTLVWNAIEDGITYAKAPNGPIRKLMEDKKGVNAVSFSPDGKRLFVTLVFYGDALYELDLAGAKPPRLVAEGMGGLNAFEVNEDGMIYGPLVFGARVVRINPDTGAMTTVSDKFESPGALKLESRNSALVLDDGLTIKRVNLANGQTTEVAKLPYGADNLDIDSKGRAFVSLSEVNAIAEVNRDTGELRYVVQPAPLTSATGLAVVSEGGADTLYLGDLFGGVRVINGDSGAIEDTPVDIFQPAHVSAAGDHLLVVSQVFGAIQRINRANFEKVAEWTGFNSPGDALEAPNGDLIVAETGAGRLLRVTGTEATDRGVVAENLAKPTGLAWAGEGAVYVTETEGGRLLRVELADGATTVVATGLQQPEGVGVTPEGAVVVVEVGAKKLTWIDPDGGEETIIASNLPIGLSNGPSLYRGVAVSPTAIYINSDVDNSIYKLTRAQ